MVPKGVKVSKVIQRRSKAKVVEWETRKLSRGTRHIPVEVSTSTPWQISRQDDVRMAADNHEEMFHKMDVNETSWVDEPVFSDQNHKRR
jgi:hypothetical protein